jgi:hypothetical protein
LIRWAFSESGRIIAILRCLVNQESLALSQKCDIEMPAIWTIRCYVSPKHVDEIRAWYDGQPKGVQGKFLSRLKTLSQLKLQDWKLPLFAGFMAIASLLENCALRFRRSSIVLLAFALESMFSLSLFAP